MRWVEKRRDEKGLDVRWDAPGGITSNRWAEIRWDEELTEGGMAVECDEKSLKMLHSEMRWDEMSPIIIYYHGIYIYIHHIMIHIMIYSIPIIIYYHAQEWKLERLKICEPQSSAWPHPIGVSIFVPLYRRFMAFQFWNFRPRLARVLLVWTQHIHIYIYVHMFVYMYINIYLYRWNQQIFVIWKQYNNFETNILSLDPYFSSIQEFHGAPLQKWLKLIPPKS